MASAVCDPLHSGTSPVTEYFRPATGPSEDRRLPESSSCWTARPSTRDGIPGTGTQPPGNVPTETRILVRTVFGGMSTGGSRLAPLGR